MPRVRNPDLVLVGIRLMKRDIAEAKRIGQARAIPYQHVIRAWVAEKAERARVKRGA
jgi:predicted DNA binding CopG/RHH family protein